MRWIWWLAIAGCATEKPAPEPVPVPVRVPVRVPVSVPAPAGGIPRCELEKVLSQSPGVFLSHVDTAPSFRGGRFQGWRVNAFFPDDPRFAGVDLRRGDVVVRINGDAVEQPEQFIHVWEGARFRRDLTVEIVRDGERRTLSWPIVE